MYLAGWPAEEMKQYSECRDLNECLSSEEDQNDFVNERIKPWKCKRKPNSLHHD